MITHHSTLLFNRFLALCRAGSGNLLCTSGIPSEEVGAAVKGMFGIAPLVENARLDAFKTRYSARTSTTAFGCANPVRGENGR